MNRERNIKTHYFLLLFAVLQIRRINSQGFRFCEYNETRLLLTDNGYDNLTISIDQDVPENFELITRLQQLLTSTSSSIYRLTRNRAYIRSVRILLPDTWGPLPQILGETSIIEGTPQNADQAQLRVRNTTPRPGQETDGSWKLGDNFAYVEHPYVIKTTPCGYPGSYMKLSPEFVLFGEEIKGEMGPAEKIVSSEWAKFRWGVYDETPRANAESEFYISTDLSTQATKCSTAIPGSFVSSSNKNEACPLNDDEVFYDRTCSFLPSSEDLSGSFGSLLFSSNLTYVDTFCDDEGEVPDEQVHNDEAPTSQNLHCGGRSIWSVMRSHPDFANGNNLPFNTAKTSVQLVDDLPALPVFTIVQNMDRRVVLVLDASNSMQNYNRLHLLRQATSHYIDTIPTQTFVGIVCFSTRAVTKSSLIEIRNNDVRELLKQRLTQLTSAGTSIGSGIRAGLNILATSGPEQLRGSGGSIIILTDGLEHNRPKINETIDEVKASGVRINTIAFGAKVAPALEELAQVSGGSTHAASSGEFGLNSELQEAFLSYNQFSDDGAIPLVSERVLVPTNSSEDQVFVIDQSVGTNTRATLFYDTDAKPIISLTSPSGQTYSENDQNEIIFFTSDDEFKTIMIRIQGQTQLGVWTLSLENPTFNSEMEIRVSVVTYRSEMEPLIISPALLCRSFVYTGVEAMVIYSDVYQGDLAVLDAYVAAIVTRPLTESGIVDTSLIELRDDGLDPDVTANDGVYSAYFIAFTSRGRYSVKVMANDNSGQARIHPRYILGIGRQQNEPVVYDTRYLATNATRRPADRTKRQAVFEGSFLPSFQRVSSGAGAFTVSQFVAEDTCSPGYTHFQDSCYKLHAEPQIPEDTAQLVCENEGGYLAEVNSRQELTWILARVTPAGEAGNVWFGGVAEELRAGGAKDIEQIITRIRRGMQDDDLEDLAALFRNDLLTEEMEFAVDSFAPYIDDLSEQETRRLLQLLGLETRSELENLKYSDEAGKTDESSRRRRQLSPGSLDLQSFLAFGQPIVLVDATTNPQTTTSPELVSNSTTFYTTSYYYVNGTMTNENSTGDDVTLSPAKKEPEVPDPRSSGADILTCSWFQNEKIIESTGDVCTTNRKFICEKGLRDRFPPSRIIDLRGRMGRDNNLLRLTFSAPGDDLNIGSAKGYEIRTLRTRKARSILKNNFELGEILSDEAIVQGSISQPLPSGDEENIVVNLTMNSECPSHASVDLIFGLPDDIFTSFENNQLSADQNSKQADVLELVSGLILNFVLSPFEMQVAVFSYPSNYSIINFSDKLSSGLEIFERLITTVIPQPTQNVTIEDRVSEMVDRGRSDSAKVLIAFTDENFEQFSNITDVTTMIVAVGENIDIGSLWNSSSYPGCNTSFIVENTADLGSLVDAISYQICEERETEYQAVGVRAFDEEGQSGAVSNILPLVSTHSRTPVACPIIEPPPTPAPIASANLAQTVGLGIGIPVVLILCIVGAVMLFGQAKKWKKKRAEKKEKEQRRIQIEKNKSARQAALANEGGSASTNNNNSSKMSIFNIFHRKIQPVNSPPV